MAADAGPIAGWQARIEQNLERALARNVAAPRLQAAMRHAALGGGKRLRPLLVYATAHALGADPALADAPAVAVELVHAFSLVHDDLPAMDDDALRRGRATVHVAFDEATAILAGDALQAEAFRVLAEAALPAAARVAMLGELAAATGAAGMCAGQMLDMQATGQAAEVVALEALHGLKTGALIRAAVALGAIAGGADAAAREALDRYAGALGLAFQIRDDLLDAQASSAALGKTAGKDRAQGKATYATLLGAEAAEIRLAGLREAMLGALEGFDDRAGALRELAGFSVSRGH